MQHGLPPGTHTSCSSVLGHELPTMSKAQPWGEACPEQGNFLPLAPGQPQRARALLSAAASGTATCQGQTVGDISQMPLEKQEFLVTAIGMKLLGPSPAHAGSGMGFLELFVISAWGLAGEGSAWLGATSPIAGSEVLGEEISDVLWLLCAMQRSESSKAVVVS